MALKASLSYWLKHPAKLGVMVIIFMSGITALVLTLLFVRSAKMQELDDSLNIVGDYDLIAFDCKYQTAAEIAALDAVGGSGIYRRIDNVTIEGSGMISAMAFRDAKSAQIFHMPMLKGRYPETPDEIALDLEYVRASETSPVIGERIRADIGGEHKEFTVVGIFSMKNDYGIYQRYYSLEDDYIPPMAILDSSYFNEDMDSSYTVFYQNDSGDPSELLRAMEQICTKHGEEQNCIKYSSRCIAYKNVLGIDPFDDMNSLVEIADAVNNGGVRKDIFSYLIPLFAVLIGIVTVISVYQLMKNIYEDRMRNSGIMLSIGMSRNARLLQLVLEPIAVMLMLMPIGLICGTQIFTQIVRHGGVHDALEADELIKSITLDPWLTAAVIICLSMLAVSVIFVCKYRRATVLELIDGRSANVRKRKLSPRRRQLSDRGWFGIVFGNISFTTVSVCLLIIIGMSSMTFGIIFSAEVGRYRSSDTAYLIEENASAQNGEDITSVSELLERYDKEKNGMKNMFLRLEIMLVILVTIGIILALYSRQRQLRATAASLRAIGMPRSKLAFVSLLQNEALVFVGAVISLLPVYTFHKLSEYAHSLADSSGAVIVTEEAADRPTDIFLYDGFFRYDMFSSKYLSEWLAVILLFAVLAAAVSILPIITQGRLGLSDDLKKE